ncbi:substrate-binding periplasmic protein [Desulfobulbus oralis]|nr:transporter substrate-binding domain-containing protein [Desulfobulbus oralis]
MKPSCFSKMLIAGACLLGILADGTGPGTAQAEDTLTVGISDDVPPICFRDNESKLVGFDVDLLQEIGKRLSRPIVFKVIEWDKKIEELNSKNIDLIASNLSITEERKKVIAYTEPLIQNAQAIIVNATSPIHTKNDIIGKKVCLLQDSNSIPIVERFNVKSGSTIKFSFSSLHDCLISLISEEVEAAVLDLTPLTYYSNQNPGQFRILADHFGEDDLAYGLRLSDRALLTQLNETIRAMQLDGTMKSIHERWFGSVK